MCSTVSSQLWRCFLQDDIDSFAEFFRSASFVQAQKGGAGSSGSRVLTGTGSLKAASPGAGLASLANMARGGRRASGPSPGGSLSDRASPWTVTPMDVNAKDSYGRTLLHLIASSPKESAINFAAVLLEVPFVDMYAQDAESGWTALHRALYTGNVAVAHALMSKDMRDAVEFRTLGGAHHLSGGLIKIKDREGNSPFEVFTETMTPSGMADVSSPVCDDASSADSHAEIDSEYDHSYDNTVNPAVNVCGNEVFTFGSNKNITLGLGDHDDRQFPERVQITRPNHLVFRFYEEHVEERRSKNHADVTAEADSVADIPMLVRSTPVLCQDVVMSKLSTGILTADPESNLFMAGFGPGGRLGTGDEGTRFSFVCIESGGLGGKRVVALALGQDHSIAVCERGEVFTWGSNKYGQLGYTPPKVSKNEASVQTTPRQIFNPFKKEVIIGAAASAIHSAVFTSTGLFTFGKNEGQLGFMDADARALDYQTLPRQVGATLFSSPIAMVSAIDRATTCLLENHDVWVFTHYGYSKIIFPLDSPSNFIKNSFMATRYAASANYITKIRSGGNTICALSNFGELYSVNVVQKVDTNSSMSTTNPAKIKNSLPQPSRIWSPKKSHMAARDLDVGQDGSVIICTASQSAWRKESRSKLRDLSGKAKDHRDYKFVRVPNLSNVVAVRSNAFGAYAAVQQDSGVARTEIEVDDMGLWDDIFPILPFADLIDLESGDVQIRTPQSVPKSLMEEEVSIKDFLVNFQDGGSFAWISTTTSDVRVPVHDFILSARSPLLAHALFEFRKSYYYSHSDVFSIEYDENGQISIKFGDVDFLSVFNLVLYMYTDRVYDVWLRGRHSSDNAARYRKVRIDILKMTTHLDMRALERAARVMVHPNRQLHMDMERAIKDGSFFDSGDVIVELDGAQVRAHGQILCHRCPFFESMFFGRSRGRWLDSRRDSELVRVDFKHTDPRTFDFVLRHIYADTDDELFEDICCESLEDLIDSMIDVMAVANELMLDRLAQVCQRLLGRFVNSRSVCHLLNAVSPCAVPNFKQAALRYVCVNLELMLSNRLLDDLDPDLFPDLDKACRDNQITCQPISRCRNSEEYLIERYPELVSQIETDRQRRIDSMKLRSRLHEDEMRDGKFHVGSQDKTSPLARKTSLVSTAPPKEPESPVLRSKQSANDLIFEMEDDPQTLETPERKPVVLDLTKMETPPRKGNLFAPETESSPVKSPWNVNISPAHQQNEASLGLKDIMAEASLSKAATQTQPGQRIKLVAPSKLTQKERKKLKQQQALDATRAGEEPASPASPWSIVGKKAPAAVDDSKATVTSAPTEPALASPKPQSRVAMTLRQTVAGSWSKSEQKTPAPATRSSSMLLPAGAAASPRPKPSLTAPQGAQIAGAAPSRQTEQTSAAPIDSIRSIRYTHPSSSSPKSTPPASYDYSSSWQQGGGFSLAAILEQQQSEKDEIREATTAKHNLQDIQVEQEFQEWWDQESKRVMAAEAEAAAAATKQAKQYRRRGGGQGEQGRQEGSKTREKGKRPRAKHGHGRGERYQGEGQGPSSSARTQGSGRSHGPGHKDGPTADSGPEAESRRGETGQSSSQGHASARGRGNVGRGRGREGRRGRQSVVLS